VRFAIVLVTAACGRFGFDSPSTTDAASVIASRSVSSTWTFTCAVTDGVMRCWGENTSGQLGTGDMAPRTSATVVAQGHEWRTVAVGSSHTCGLTTAGEVYCWGGSPVGQLGLGDLATQLVPTRVTLPAPALFLQARDSNTCAVLETADLLCWGHNGEGQLANFTIVDSPLPVSVQPALTWLRAANGQAHTLAIAGDNTLWGSGRNTSNELALPLPPSTGQARQMTAAMPGAWARVTGGQNHSCGIDTSARLFCWGANGHGQLGVNDLIARDVPSEAIAPVSWREVSTHTFETCGIDTGGQLWCWGRNAEGQLGTGDFIDRMAPAPVSPVFTDWVDVTVGRFHVCAMRADGSVWCTGANDAGQLGTGDLARRGSFTLVSF
jgi:alpha-tubulin suppressor-like RCC1 family protein